MLNMMMVTSQLVDLEHTLQFHQPILVAIEQRNPALASHLMTDHLTDARRSHASHPPAGDLPPAPRSPRRWPISPQALSQVQFRIEKMNESNVSQCELI